jgi:hypothetical protein
MRIDSGLSNHFYQSRVRTLDGQVEDAGNEVQTQTRPRSATNPAMSSTLLSASLASALWSIEGDRRGNAAASTEEVPKGFNAEFIEAFYLEHTLDEDAH